MILTFVFLSFFCLLNYRHVAIIPNWRDRDCLRRRAGWDGVVSDRVRAGHRGRDVDETVSERLEWFAAISGFAGESSFSGRMLFVPRRDVDGARSPLFWFAT